MTPGGLCLPTVAVHCNGPRPRRQVMLDRPNSQRLAEQV